MLMLPDWTIGVLLSVFAAVLINFGMLFQRLAHGRLLSPGQNVYLTSPWIAGMSFLVVGSLVDFIALAFVAASIVATLGSATLLLNVLLSPIVLGEKITKRQLQSTLVIVVGNVMVVSYASHDSKPMNVWDIAYRTLEVDVMAYALLIAGVLIYLFHIVFTDKSNVDSIKRRNSDELSCRSGSGGLLRLAYPCIGGMFGACNMITARCLSLALRSDSLLSNFYAFPFWLVLGSVAIFSLLQVHFLNAGLRRFQASRVVPIYQSAMCLWSVASSMVFFSEYKGQSNSDLLWFCFGVLVTMVGQAGISLDPSYSHPEHEYTLPTSSLDRSEKYRVTPCSSVELGRYSGGYSRRVPSKDDYAQDDEILFEDYLDRPDLL